MELIFALSHTVRMAKKPSHPGHFIRAWRQAKELSLEKLASRVGTTHATLSRIERGKLPYSQPLLEAVAEALGCSPADLIVRDPSQPGAIWTIWDQIPPVQREQAAKVLETFTKKAG